MAVKAMTLVGLDVHARQRHAAIVGSVTGEVRVSKLRMAPIEVASFLEGLGPDVLAVYEAGPTGFGLARAARECGVNVRVAAPGSIPKGPGDRVKTDRRDAIRLVRLLAAGESATFADYLASVELLMGRRPSLLVALEQHGPRIQSRSRARRTSGDRRRGRGGAPGGHRVSRCQPSTPARSAGGAPSSTMPRIGRSSTWSLVEAC